MGSHSGRLARFVLILLGSFVVALSAQTPSTGIIRGIVVDTRDLTPLRGTVADVAYRMDWYYALAGRITLDGGAHVGRTAMTRHSARRISPATRVLNRLMAKLVCRSAADGSRRGRGSTIGR